MKQTLCLVDGCERSAHTAKACSQHYQIHRAWGVYERPPVPPCSICGGEARRPNSRRKGEPAMCSFCRESQWRDSDPERRRAAGRRQWRLNVDRNRSMARAKQAKHRATSPYSAKEYADLVAQRFFYWGNRCYMCGRDDVPMHADHVISISKGGKSLPANIRPACQPCNTRKMNHDWKQYV